MPRRSQAQAGYSLLECLIYIAVLAVIMELAFEAYYRVDLHNRHLTRNAADIVRVLQAGERWREDVRSATGGPVPAGAGTDQELHIPRKNGEVTYAFREGTVWRRSSPAGDWREFLPGVKRSRMVADSREKVAAWRWELELQSTQQVVRLPPLFTFLAAVPGQSRP